MRKLVSVFVLGICISFVGASWAPPAFAAHAAQGRVQKKAKKKKAPKTRVKTSAPAPSSKKAAKDRGFEL